MSFLLEGDFSMYDLVGFTGILVRKEYIYLYYKGDTYFDSAEWFNALSDLEREKAIYHLDLLKKFDNDPAHQFVKKMMEISKKSPKKIFYPVMSSK